MADPLNDKHGDRFAFDKDEWTRLEDARAYGSAAELLRDLGVLTASLAVQQRAVTNWLASQSVHQTSVSRLLIDDLQRRNLIPPDASKEPPRTESTGEVVIDLAEYATRANDDETEDD